MSGPRKAVQQEVQEAEYAFPYHYSSEILSRGFRQHFETREVHRYGRRGWQRGLLNRLLSNHLCMLNKPRLLNVPYDWHRRSMFLCADVAVYQRIHVRVTAL